MKIGLNTVPVPKEQLADAARLAEALRFESIWVGEHIALPFNPKTPYPYGEASFRPDTEFLEPFVAMAHLAAVTDRIRLGSGIAILSARQFFTTARAITTLDNLSGGRLDLGVGAGWSPDEYELLGFDFRHRGKRLDEFLDALECLWRDDKPSYHGRHIRFNEVAFEPKPFQKPRVPIHVGGFKPAALKRAAAKGDGWYGSARSPEEARASVETLHGYRKEYRRDDKPFEISLVLFGPTPDPDTVAAYEDAGVHRLVLTPFDVRCEEKDAPRKIKDCAQVCGLKAARV